MSGPDGALAVVFDKGAATPGELGAGLRRIGAPAVTVLGTSAHARAMRPLLEQFGPVLGLDEGIPRVVDGLRRAGTRGITTFSEQMQVTTAVLAAELGLPYHTPDVARLVTDKHAQRRRLAEAGVPQARSHSLTAAGDWPEVVSRVGLPAVVKPAVGEGSRDVHLVEDEEAGRRLVMSLLSGPDAPPLVVEEFLAGRDETPLGDFVSVECLVSGGKARALAVTGKFPLLPPFREVGQFRPTHLGDDEAAALGELAVDAIHALGVETGLSHTEIKLTPHGPKVIEVNGRLGGLQTELAMRAVGVDLVEVGGRLALGEEVNVPSLTPDQVCFQYICPAPTRPCRLEEVRGLADVRRIPGISVVRPVLRAGDEIGGGVGTSTLALIGGLAPDHAAMLDMIDRATRSLTWTFSGPDGRRRSMTGSDLRA